ncbi:hypothetical protein I302_104356 [Kwoniella bestiolae CBS 10118]|uniref:CBF1-interacting co-repressor CIR N-terminal domain-containing protein n=1 Tax=Kwoniella bestiolae CBS 10118 TaxID=1296100 RepID=A0A1B9GB32_9TREE|nr:hypothetical protein I302_03064 [Kwoniella bestiolae CBS 10118]OCF28212.1 hypothetical protein I302_03064 [Kwoniella bestiolae CBS 10118]
MPRLQILHHKSYHPYLEKNKQRVREDEARAAAEELAKEQKSIDAEAENRLSLLRRRAGSPSFQNDEGEGDLPSTSASRDSGKSLLERHREKKAKEEKRERKRKDRLDFDFPSETARRNKGKEKEKYNDDEEERGEMGKWETGGHLNFFADLEKDPKLNKPQPTLAELAKTKKDQESDPFTLYLARPDKETKPWYADKDLKRVEDKEVGDEADERRERDRRKDARSKNRNDPLTHISTLLSTSSSKSRPHHHHTDGHHKPSNPSDARRSRELSERERALALIAKSKAPQRIAGGWDDTPSSAGGRTWAEEWEREQAKAGRRFFERDERPRSNGGRSWEV